MKLSQIPNISSVLKSVQKPGRYIGGEYNAIIKDKEKVKCRFAFCFPDTYEIGMSNLGVRILYGVLNEEKDVWFQGRALWVLCKAYNTIEKNEAYLKAAKCIYDFLPKCEDTDGRMFFTVTADGCEIQKRRYYFSETFFAIGCAEYYRACGDKAVLESARKYFDVAYDCFTGKIYCYFL